MLDGSLWAWPVMVGQSRRLCVAQFSFSSLYALPQMLTESCDEGKSFAMYTVNLTTTVANNVRTLTHWHTQLMQSITWLSGTWMPSLPTFDIALTTQWRSWSSGCSLSASAFSAVAVNYTGSWSNQINGGSCFAIASNGTASTLSGPFAMWFNASLLPLQGLSAAVNPTCTATLTLGSMLPIRFGV